jgi:UDP:flavonoid glycosyltransferase YjiC (YdhE family)
MLDERDLLPRKIARSRLGLPNDANVVYVQLGAGEINDIESEVRMTLECLLEDPSVHVVLGESLIGERINIEQPRLLILRDYPNSMYFKGFDATVQAGGYNSFHETRTFGLPALFYPNMNTGMDDQLARCKVAEEEGWGIVLEKRNRKAIEESCSKLFDLVGNILPTKTPNGAHILSETLLEVISNEG